MPIAAQPSRSSQSVKSKNVDDAPSKRRQPTLLLQRAQIAPETLTSTDVLSLQRTIGNRATVGLLSRSSGLQAKLKLGPAGDKHEQEADRVADQVVRQMDPSQPVDTHVQRHVDEDELAQMKPLHGAEGGEVESSVARQIQSARGGGQPLNDGIRAKMERGFGADFSGVRVHTGGQADTLNRSLNARAFTVGNDVFFGKGQYNPGSNGGQKLLAHELTHTVQQGAAGVQRKDQQENIVRRWPWSKKKNNISGRRRGSFSSGHIPDMNEIEQEPETNVEVATLRLATDKGGERDVGHSWVELRYDEEKAGAYTNLINRLPIVEYGKRRLVEGLHDSWGFYPRMFTKNEATKSRMQNREKAGATPGMGKSLVTSDTGFRQLGQLIKNPSAKERGEKKHIWASPRTQGRVEEPDDDHIASARMSYRVTHKQVELMTKYIDSKRDADYSPYKLNCTSFAIGAAKAAGQSPPSGTWFSFSKPRALFDQIVEQENNKSPNAFVRKGHSLFSGLMGKEDKLDPEAWAPHDFSKKEEVED